MVERSGGIRDGARVVLRASLGPVTTRWEVEHRDYVDGVQFRDVQRSGPFARWSHLHRVEPEGDSASVLTDDIDFALPFGPIGALGAPVARHQLARLFAYRHAVTAADLARHQRHADRGTLRIAITGATGMIGSALAPFLTAGGHHVARVTRSPREAGDIAWDPERGVLDPAALEGFDAVVHLAGASIADRWTDEQRRHIRDSRVRGTTLLAATLARLARPPKVLLSGSAVGIYGDRGDEILDEASAPGAGFLADVAREWEASTGEAERAGIRVAHLRTGLVLTTKGGLLAKLLTPVRLGVGGPLASGRQWMSWIALDDVVGAMHHLLFADDVRGPVNVVGPAPVTNADFAQALGRVLRRPAVAPVPAFALRLLLGGEQADELALASQRVLPRVLQRSGFEFRHATVDDALRFELGRT